MTEIYFNGEDGKSKVKTLTIHQNGDYVSYEIETEFGVKYHSPMFKRVD